MSHGGGISGDVSKKVEGEPVGICGQSRESDRLCGRCAVLQDILHIHAQSYNSIGSYV